MRIKANHFAKIIKEKRQTLKLSQVDAEQSILQFKKCKGQYWSNIERGLCTISPKHLSRASVVLKVPIDELVDAYVSDYRESVLFEISK
jgi:transcriptional regulator with XRE-family HTH domain